MDETQFLPSQAKITRIQATGIAVRVQPGRARKIFKNAHMTPPQLISPRAGPMPKSTILFSGNNQGVRFTH